MKTQSRLTASGGRASFVDFSQGAERWLSHLLTAAILLGTVVAALPALAADPVTQLAELTASDGVGADYFGGSVSISGNTVVVQSEGLQSDVTDTAYVFVKPSNGWGNMTQTAKLSATNGRVSGAVSISDNTIVAGGYDSNTSQQVVYVFVEPPSGWTDMTETAELSDGQTGDTFGNSVAISGNTIVVGAEGTTFGNQISQGAVYVFVKPAGGWKTTSKPDAQLTASDGVAYDQLGQSVAISGNTIASGALGHNHDSGAAYVFVKPASGWKTMTQTAELTASDGQGTGDELGLSVTISGNTVVAGTPYHPSTIFASVPGAAYVFVEPTKGWTNMTESAEITASNGVKGDDFAFSVSLTPSVLLVGAPGANYTGSAYVFVKPKSGWKTTSTFYAEAFPGNGQAFEGFGSAVALGGTTAAIGSPGQMMGNQSAVGAAYVFGP